MAILSEDSNTVDVGLLTTLLVRAGLSAQFCRRRSRGWSAWLTRQAAAWEAQGEEWERQATELAELLEVVRAQAQRQGFTITNDLRPITRDTP